VADAEAGFERTELPGGLRVLTERMPAVRSVTLGIWAGVGSRDETPRLAGASHYLEHLLFKGTERRSARDIAEAMDAVGGETNAFTSKEYTCFYARTLDRDLPLAVDVLVDMLRSSKMAAADVDAERTVILEEIGMHNDAPDDVVHDLFAEALFGGHPLGRPVLGTVDSITSHAARRHRPLLAAPLRARQPGGGGGRQPGARPGGRAGRRGASAEAGRASPSAPARAGASRGSTAGSRSGASRPSRPTWCWAAAGCPGPTRAASPSGCSTSPSAAGSARGCSRRCGRSAAWSTRSTPTPPSTPRPGSFSVYAGAAPKRIHDVLAIVRDELERVVADGLTEAELERGKGHLEGSLVLGMEDTSGRMTRLGKSELTFGEILSVDEVIRRVDAVTDADVAPWPRRSSAPGPRALALIGPFDDDGFSQYVS
jgi:hypothetical protein